MFLISAEIYIFGALIYIILGRGERQWWAGGEERVADETDNGDSLLINSGKQAV